MKQIHEFENEEKWLNLRLDAINSTEISALFDCNPYMTDFELFLQKRDRIVKKIDSEFMKFGRALEPVIAQHFSDVSGLKISKFSQYIIDTESKIGSSFDYEIESGPSEDFKGPGILEIKNVDYFQFKKNWLQNDDGSIEATPYIELQVQHQLEVADLEWCCIAALVGGNKLETIYRKRDRDIGKAIKKKADKFWSMIEKNEAPKIDYNRDADLVIEIHGLSSDRIIDASEDVDLEDLMGFYNFASEEEKKWESDKLTYKAKILEKIGDAGSVIFKSGKLSSGMTKASEGKLITQEMVGTRINARPSFRQFRFNKKDIQNV